MNNLALKLSEIEKQASGLTIENAELKDNLTKAKEILEDIIKFQPYIDRDAMFLTKGNDWKEVIFKAEQFIKDSEVKK